MHPFITSRRKCCIKMHPTDLRLPGDSSMTRFLAAQLANSHYFDISAARRDLGYKPLVSTEAGEANLIEWLRHSEPGARATGV
ncbi:MAG: hypothetical protein HYR83_04445 [Planctomycetes bacterium]|nr:hypothetical protein [Planctomycetota bacterium]